MTNALELSLQDDLAGEGDSFFTDEVVAEIRAAQAEARAGESVSIDQFRIESRQRNAEWLANRRA